MHDGGEARLARKKGKKRPLSAGPAGREVDAEGRGARDRDRFCALWQDYHDLLKVDSVSRPEGDWIAQETDGKKRRLESMNQRKLGLLAEVKFLRKKYSSFVKDDPQQPQHRLKKRARQIPSPLGNSDAAYGGPTEEGPSTSKNTNLNLNQDSLMNGEGADCQGHRDNSVLGRFDQAVVDEDIMATDASLSVSRDTGNSPATDDKMTVVLKV